MKIIGLLGGVASGKSTVAEMFRELGAGILDADRAGHEVLKLPAIRAAIGGRWGQAVIGPDGEVDRKALAGIVFAPAPEGLKQLAELERITHPEIRRRILDQAQKLAANGTKVSILDAPVLLKAGWADVCDALVFVDAPLEQRQARASRRGWSAEELARREAAQEPIEEKRRMADFVLENSGDLSYIRTQVERCWHSLIGPAD